ncbi:MAG: serine protease, partial [Chloroflexota bacterium]
MTRSLAVLAALALLVSACGGAAAPAATPAATAATKSDTNEQGNTSKVQTQAPAATSGPDENAIDRAMLGTVQIYVLDPDNRVKGSCSGTNFHPAGYILTNWHCVGVTHIYGRVSTPHGTRYHPLGYVAVGPTKDPREAPVPTYLAQLIAGSPDQDIAVVKIVDTLGRGTTLPDKLALPVVPTGDSDRVKVGEKMHVIGYPGSGGDFVTRTTGTIAGFFDFDGNGKPDAFKTDAKAGPGVSGGLWVNEKGEQIGVATFGSNVGAGDPFNGAVFVNLARPFMEQAVSLAGTTVGPPARTVTLPGTAPGVSATRPTPTPRVTPTPRPTPSASGTPRATATAARTPGASPTAAPGGTTARSTSIVISGSIVDTDTKRP